MPYVARFNGQHNGQHNAEVPSLHVGLHSRASSALTTLLSLGIPAPRAGVWTIAQTQRLLARLDDA